MDNLALCKSALFRSNVADSILLARNNYPKEVGFGCWIDEEKLVINRPVLGDDYLIRDHHEVENRHEPFTGFRVGEGSQIVISFHTHPSVDEAKEETEWLVAPSIPDMNFHLADMKENRIIAELCGRESWVNPISVIASPATSRWGLFQIDPVATYKVNFNRETLWSQAVWVMFRRYYPQHAKKGTGMIAELFGPKQDPLNKMIVGTMLGKSMRVPRFLTLSPDRYREFLKAAGITWILINPSNPPVSWNFSYQISDLKEESEDDEYYDEKEKNQNYEYYDDDDSLVD